MDQVLSGYKAIATPGSIHGLWTAFKQFGSGKLAWQQLLLPTVQLLEEGFPVSPMMASGLRAEQEALEQQASFK